MGGLGPVCTRDCDGVQGSPRSDSRMRLRVGESPPPASPLEGEGRGPPTHVGALSLGRLGTRLVADERGHGAEAPRDPTLAMASRPPGAAAEESTPPPAPSSRPRVGELPGWVGGGVVAVERWAGAGAPRAPARATAPKPPRVTIRGSTLPLPLRARPRSVKPPGGAGGERARLPGRRGAGVGGWVMSPKGAAAGSTDGRAEGPGIRRGAVLADLPWGGEKVEGARRVGGASRGALRWSARSRLSGKSRLRRPRGARGGIYCVLL